MESNPAPSSSTSAPQVPFFRVRKPMNTNAMRKRERVEEEEKERTNKGKVKEWIQKYENVKWI